MKKYAIGNAIKLLFAHKKIRVIESSKTKLRASSPDQLETIEFKLNGHNDVDYKTSEKIVGSMSLDAFVRKFNEYIFIEIGEWWEENNKIVYPLFCRVIEDKKEAYYLFSGFNGTSFISSSGSIISPNLKIEIVPLSNEELEAFKKGF